MYRIYRIFHPEIFQGKYKKENYFEGWYFKIIDRRKANAISIIPGVSLNNKTSHAFIQILRKDSSVYYIRYALSEFSFDESSFYIKVGENEFTRDRIKLNIETEGLSIHGELSFKHIIELPKTLLRPGIMGPFSYLTFMECYHGVVNIHHDIEGCLNISGRNIDFTGGYGYIEKDWGRSFPENWVWLQSNHFGEDDVTVMFSKAKIPFLGSSFEGFLSLLRIKDRVLVFATYTGAKLRKVEIDDHILRIRINNIRFQLELLVLLSEGGRIIAPKNGRMNREIIESINAVVKVRLSSRGGRILYEGQGTNTGLEIVVE